MAAIFPIQWKETPSRGNWAGNSTLALQGERSFLGDFFFASPNMIKRSYSKSAAPGFLEKYRQIIQISPVHHGITVHQCSFHCQTWSSMFHPAKTRSRTKFRLESSRTCRWVQQGMLCFHCQAPHFYKTLQTHPTSSEPCHSSAPQMARRHCKLSKFQMKCHDLQHSLWVYETKEPLSSFIACCANWKGWQSIPLNEPLDSPKVCGLQSG